MKIMETATFFFTFKDTSKNESQEKPQDFLMANGWLTSEKVRVEPLNSYHTKENGECEVVLAQDSTDDDFIELIDDLFDNLIECEEILWVKTIFNHNTAKIVYNNIDKYTENQTIDIYNMKYGDTAVIFMRK